VEGLGTHHSTVLHDGHSNRPGKNVAYLLKCCKQCFLSGSAWIRIRMTTLDPDPHYRCAYQIRKKNQEYFCHNFIDLF
jgi:hypothetical protein